MRIRKQFDTPGKMNLRSSGKQRFPMVVTLLHCPIDWPYPVAHAIRRRLTDSLAFISNDRPNVRQMLPGPYRRVREVPSPSAASGATFRSVCALRDSENLSVSMNPIHSQKCSKLEECAVEKSGHFDGDR